MALEIDLGPQARQFRDELRGWLAENKPLPRDLAPGEDPHDPRRPAGIDVEDWTKRLQEAGYLCVSWPKEFGGRGLTGIEVAVMNDEFAKAGVPRITRGMGETLVGPAIIVWATDEQKAHFLPRIIDGTDRYCQGFSEPDAGSDLASLKTRGVIDGDEIIINGQKVWTSGAQLANMIFVLCRTDPDAPKHRGISYVLCPMFRDDGTRNGIELRPIKQITGGAHFTETFFEDARAPVFNIIGGVNNGWRATMTTLGNERGGSATTQHVQHSRDFWGAVKLVKDKGLDQDPLVRQQLAWAYSHVEIMRFQGLRLLSALASRIDPGPSSSINKMFWSEYQQRFAELILQWQGMESTVVGDDYRLGRWQQMFLTSRSHTIWGGTAQVQRNIVGERVLGLPKEPGMEADRGDGPG
jgi:alkylation response protein AidB-like acyl-CoA dehydrogenase